MEPTNTTRVSVQEWRARRLRERGVDAALATEIVADEALDLHALLDLLDRGCPPELALRIVAPIDREPSSA